MDMALSLSLFTGDGVDDVQPSLSPAAVSLWHAQLSRVRITYASL